MTDVKKGSLFKTILGIPWIRRFFLFVRYGIFHKPFFSRRMTVTIQDRIKFDIDFVFARHKYEGLGERHNAGFLRWIDFCRGKHVIFDIGAHIGLYTIPASRVTDPEGRIYAFEPSPANCEYLKRHLKYNRCANVSVEPVLVGECLKSQVEFYEHRKADPMNALTIRPDMMGYGKVTRPQITLDDFCQRKSVFPDVIKMDIEGAELRAFKGAVHLLRYKHPPIFLSLHPDRMAMLGDSVSDLAALLSDLNYTWCYPDGRKAEGLPFGEYLLIPSREPDE